MLFGVAYLTRRKGLTKASKALFIAAVVLLWLFASPSFAYLLLRPLESSYSSLRDPNFKCDVIVVLGSGHRTNPNLSSNVQLSQAAQSRLLEGVRLAHLYPNAKLILSGYGGSDEKSHAVVMANAAVEQGLNPLRLFLAPFAKDTMEEATAILALIPDREIVLVTEASHMTRASKIFNDHGFTVTASPAQFYTKGKWGPFSKPGAGGLRMTERAFHEYSGLAWAYTKAFFSD